MAIYVPTVWVDNAADPRLNAAALNKIEQGIAAAGSTDSPTFTGTVTLPSTTTIGTVSSVELGYLDGVTSGIQSQLDAKAPLASPALTGTPTVPTATAGTNTTQIASTAYVRTEVASIVNSAPATLDTLNEIAAALGSDPNFATTMTNLINTKAPSASPTFTGTVVLPSTTSIGTITSTELGYLDGVTSSIQTQLGTKAPSADPTFTGTVTLPSTTSIGNVSSTEIGYLDGVTSAIQTQLNGKQASGSYLTANQTITLSGDASGSGTTAITVVVVDDSHNHTGSTISALDAGDTTTGTFNIARIPTGTTSSTVSLGDHTHAAYAPLASPTFTGKVTTAATSASAAGLIIPPGTAPSSPVDGDVWTATAGMYYRNGSTTQHVPRVTVSTTAPASPVDGDLWVDTSTPTWTAPTFQNSWVNYGSEWNSAGYYKDANGVVHLRGLVKSGSIGAIFTLPAGYRPTATWLFICASNSSATPPGYARVDINTSGSVSLNTYSANSNNGWVSLDGITFATF